jgi:hypothetical protein
MSLRRWVLSTVIGLGALGGVAAAQAPPCQCGPMMGGGGPRGAGMGPGCGAMIRRTANVTVEETDDGAIIRLRAKDPSQVAAVQRHAQAMSSCMGGAPPSPPSE